MSIQAPSRTWFPGGSNCAAWVTDSSARPAKSTSVVRLQLSRAIERDTQRVSSRALLRVVVIGILARTARDERTGKNEIEAPNALHTLLHTEGDRGRAREGEGRRTESKRSTSAKTETKRKKVYNRISSRARIHSAQHRSQRITCTVARQTRKIITRGRFGCTFQSFTGDSACSAAVVVAFVSFTRPLLDQERISNRAEQRSRNELARQRGIEGEWSRL